MMGAIWEGFRRAMQWLLRRPVTYLADRYSSAPKREAVFGALEELYQAAIDPDSMKSDFLSLANERRPVIIFSDQHKGGRNGADDFAIAEKNYLAALDYYNQLGFYCIALGDCEELWENSIFKVLKHNRGSFDAERRFIERDAFCKVYGNHDVFWRHDPLKELYLKQMYGQAIPIYGGIVIRVPVEGGEHIDVFCTHGHQGDAQSDGNWLSAAFVTYIWGPLQAFLRININSPSSMIANKTLHNRMMYEWSASKENVVLITGHTHQPVFNSLTRLERLHILIAEARQAGNETLLHQYLNELPERQRELPVVSEDFLTMKPSYFNTGCCCFSNGTISGIEAHEGMLRLVLWKYKDGVPTRVVAEETSLMDLGRKIMRQG